jgi:hypothetical protein
LAVKVTVSPVARGFQTGSDHVVVAYFFTSWVTDPGLEVKFPSQPGRGEAE